MTALEKIGSPPTQLGGTALYDWDYLVQEDRAHRLIYTDPGDLRSRDDATSSAAPGPIWRTKAKFRTTTTLSPGAWVCGR